MDFLLWLIIGICTAFWRVFWIGLILPVWRIGWKGAAAVAALIWVGWKLEAEAEAGAYHK